MEAYYTYLTLAERDAEPVRAQVLRHLATSPWPPWPRAQILVWGLEVGIPKTCPIGHEIQHDATRS